MKKFLNVALIATVLLSSFSCQKEGPQGPAGTDGQDGNANVKSGTYYIYSGDWTTNGTAYQANFSASEITTDISENGAVLLYVRSNNGYVALPATIVVNADYSTTINYAYAPGSVGITIQDTDNALGGNPGYYEFKVVCIESSGIAANPDVDLNNYEEVAERFEIN